MGSFWKDRYDHIVLDDIGCGAVIVDLVPVSDFASHGERHTMDGYSIRYIADILTERGIPTPAGASKWSVTTIRSILSNEKYMGNALLMKSYTVH